VRRTTTVIVLGIVLTLLTACNKAGCPTLPVKSGIQIQVPAGIQAVVHTLRIELCQGERCKAVDFASRTTDPKGVIDKGISLHGENYDVDLGRLGTGWKAGTVSGLTILGTTKSGRLVLSHTEQFTFVSAYPNGKDCEDLPSLTYATSVGGADLKS
jgi:hypothetical protein